MMEKLNILLLCVVLCHISGCIGSVARIEAGEVSLFASAAEYDVETTVLLNDAARSDREVGYKIRAHLAVTPHWTASNAHYLLQFTLKTPKLHLRGKHRNAEFLPKESIWDSHSHSIFYAEWNHGLIEGAYLDTNEHQDIVNYKKSLISLFQFQMLDLEHNETDISGTCETTYESLSLTVIRKIKKRCIWMGSDGSEGDVITSRRLTRYELAEGLSGLQAVYAEELHTAAASSELGLKARAWTVLHRTDFRDAQHTPQQGALDDVLHALPAQLHAAPLLMEPTTEPDNEPELLELVDLHRAALQSDAAGAGGDAAHARAVLQLLPALRVASTERLVHLLQHPDNHPILAHLCRLVGLAGTATGLAAARAALQLDARDVLAEHAQHYLAGLARASQPHDSVIADVVRLGVEGKVESVRAAAALAGAAAAARGGAGAARGGAAAARGGAGAARGGAAAARGGAGAARGGAAAARGGAGAARGARASLVRGLQRCKDDDCRINLLHALGNLRSGESTELLLEHGAVLRGEGAALAALQALDALPADAVPLRAVPRLLRAALLGRRLATRAAALDLCVRRALPLPAAMQQPALALHAPPGHSHELRRLFWQRMHALARRYSHVQDAISEFHPSLRTWDAQAHAGTSSVMSLGLELEEWGWSGALDSVQVVSGGMLQRGRVTLTARPAAAAASGKIDTREDLPALELELWTRGLESFAGDSAGEAEEGEEAEEPAAGLAFSVLGARLPPVTLFSGQTELLGLVWSGAGSEPTPALRAEALLAGGAARVALGVGAALRARAGAVAAGAVDARASVSLWARSAAGAVAMRAGIVADAELSVSTAWGDVTAELNAHVEPRLTLRAALDFYSQPPQLCLRLYTDDRVANRTVSLQSRQGARALSVRRHQSRTDRRAGRTLCLGALNAAACRALPAGDDAD